jgi:hypothetical protein
MIRIRSLRHRGPPHQQMHGERDREVAPRARIEVTRVRQRALGRRDARQRDLGEADARAHRNLALGRRNEHVLGRPVECERTGGMAGRHDRVADRDRHLDDVAAHVRIDTAVRAAVPGI